MSTRKFFLNLMCVLALSAGFASCDDDDDDDSWMDGSKVELPKERSFILNEGSYNMNNASITFVDPAGKTKSIDDIYSLQNGKGLGDTAQDMIEYKGNLYVAVYGSNYITKLNGAGVEQCRYQVPEDLGQPRYLTAEDGKIYVTLYGGYVARLDAKTLAFEAKVKVGNNPEYITEEDGKLYCVNSGWGADNRLSIIDIHQFTEAEQVEIFMNPEKIISEDDHIYIQGYGSNDYLNYPYPVAEFNPNTKTYTEIGKGTHLAADDNMLYVINSQTDWTTYQTVNEFYSYNAKTKKVNKANFLKNMPEELKSASIYMFNIDDETGDMYIGVTYFKSSNGDIYHFKADGSFVKKFATGGQNPRKIVFVD